MNTMDTAIATHPFTRGINPRYLHLLTKGATYERFWADQPIFQETFDADRFYLIHSGHVALHTFIPGRGVTTIETLGGGDALGWSWMFAPYRWHFSATAADPTEAVALCARTLRDEMEENRDFGYWMAMRVSGVLLERLQMIRVRMLEMYDPPE
jgi:CRP-like cAMP-binding protein